MKRKSRLASRAAFPSDAVSTRSAGINCMKSIMHNASVGTMAGERLLLTDVTDTR